MKAIILKNKIRLISCERNFITLEINVPEKNIQKMIDATGCRVIRKSEVKLNHRNYAGVVFSVQIRVQFSKIEKYLKSKFIIGCSNKDAYIDMLAAEKRPLFHAEANLKYDGVPLYAFGQLLIDSKPAFDSTIYFDKNGKKTSLINRDLNSFGDRRYVKINGAWYSNRKF